MALWKFTEDGSVDSNFGDDGIVLYNSAFVGDSKDLGKHLTIDSTGKILVVGHSENQQENNDITIWRYNQDGSLDHGFGINGIVSYDSDPDDAFDYGQ